MNKNRNKMATVEWTSDVTNSGTYFRSYHYLDQSSYNKYQVANSEFSYPGSVNNNNNNTTPNNNRNELVARDGNILYKKDNDVGSPCNTKVSCSAKEALSFNKAFEHKPLLKPSCKNAFDRTIRDPYIPQQQQQQQIFPTYQQDSWSISQQDFWPEKQFLPKSDQTTSEYESSKLLSTPIYHHHHRHDLHHYYHTSFLPPDSSFLNQSYPFPRNHSPSNPLLLHPLHPHLSNQSQNLYNEIYRGEM